jgi:hypothetical protein
VSPTHVSSVPPGQDHPRQGQQQHRPADGDRSRGLQLGRVGGARQGQQVARREQVGSRIEQRQVGGHFIDAHAVHFRQRRPPEKSGQGGSQQRGQHQQDKRPGAGRTAQPEEGAVGHQQQPGEQRHHVMQGNKEREQDYRQQEIGPPPLVRQPPQRPHHPRQDGQRQHFGVGAARHRVEQQVRRIDVGRRRDQPPHLIRPGAPQQVRAARRQPDEARHAPQEGIHEAQAKQVR